MDLALKEKRALVTGSSAGIGAAIARTLAREGASVVVHGRDQARTEGVARAICDAGQVAVAVTGDLATDAGAAAVAKAAHAAAGDIDILVNNAGSYASTPWLDTPLSRWREVFETDVLSAVRMVGLIVPAMRHKGWGRIINIATGLAAAPQPVMADYAAAKAALVNATVSLAKALAGSGITVNAVSPGLIATGGVETVLQAEAKARNWGSDWTAIQKRWLSEVLRSDFVARLGQPEEVADLVAFLASRRADYIHGANLRIDGGLAPSIN